MGRSRNTDKVKSRNYDSDFPDSTHRNKNNVLGKGAIKCRSKTKTRSKSKPKLKVKSKEKEKRKRKNTSSLPPTTSKKKKKKNEESPPSSSPSFSIPYEWMDMTKSPLDPNQYKIFRFPNGLTSCLVSRFPDSSIPPDLDLSRPHYPTTCCLPQVQEFNEKFVGLYQKLGPDMDHMSLLERVAYFPSNWSSSVDRIPDKDPPTQPGWTIQKLPKQQVKSRTPCVNPMNNHDHKQEEEEEEVGTEKGQYGISICVKSGSAQDPPSYPGMAHLCEHCVFEGTKKYLNASQNLFQSCREVNALTERDRTVYYAKVDSLEAFGRVALIFADMMTSPLFLDEAIRSEISIIDSESTIRQSFDTVRCIDLLHSHAKPTHPLHLYACGDESTLRKPGISSALRQWHRLHYQPSNMVVVFEGPSPLSSLMTIQIQNFYIPTSQSSPSSPKMKVMTREQREQQQQMSTCPISYLPSFPYDLPTVNRIFFVNPFQDIQLMMLTWLLPPATWLNFGTKPLNYIALLLAHQGPGSLHHWLMTRGWIVSIKCHPSQPHFYTNTTSHASLILVLELTGSGLKNATQILIAIFSYVQMLKQNGPKRRIFDEMRRQTATRFHFDRHCSPRKNPYAQGHMLVISLHVVTLENVAPSFALANSLPLYTKYDPLLIQKCLTLLTPDNVNVMLVSRAFGPITTHIHPNILTEWTGMDFDLDLRTQLKNVKPSIEFDLPKPNLYLEEGVGWMNCQPVQYFIGGMVVKEILWQLQSTGKASVICHHTNNSDRTRKNSCLDVPEVGTFTFMITSALASSAQPSSAVMAELWVDILKKKIKTKFYDAFLAGIIFNLYVGEHGLFFYLHGPLLWLVSIWLGVLDEFVNFEKRLERGLFNNLKSYLEKSYGNTLSDSEMLAFDLRLFMTSTNYTTMLRLQKILQGVTYEEFLQFTSKFKSRMWIYCELFGGLTQTQLVTVVESIMKLNYTPLSIRELCNLHTLRLPKGEKCLRVKSTLEKNYNSFIINHFQMGPLEKEEILMCHLIVGELSTFMFQNLRTEQGIGYRVWTMYDYTLGISGIDIWVNAQSDKFSTGFVDESIDDALAKFYATHLATDSDIRGLFKIKEPTPESVPAVDESIHRKKNLKGEDEKGKRKMDSGSQFTKGRVEDKLAQAALFNDPKFPSKIQSFYAAHLPHDRKSVTDRRKYRKLSVQIVGSLRDPESRPREEIFMEVKMNRNKCPGSTKASGNVNGSESGKHSGNEDVGIHLDIPAEVGNEDCYFIRDVVGFKSQLMIYPNL